MKCQLNKNCNGKGQVYVNGLFIGRCECFREKVLAKFFYDWSTSTTKFIQKDDLNDENILFESKKDQAVNNKTAIEKMTEIKDVLIETEGTIILEGKPETGKTTFGNALALEMVKSIDLSPAQLDYMYYTYTNVSDWIHGHKLYDTQYVQELERKVKKSSILILDDLGEELEITDSKRGVDKRKTDALGLLKQLMDKFKGVIIVTTNLPMIESRYKEINSRLHSRLFGSVESEEERNILIYQFTQAGKRKQKASKEVKSLKNMFRSM